MSNLYENDKEKKPSNQIIIVSCRQQPVHNELTRTME